jgi:hypothetical protein
MKKIKLFLLSGKLLLITSSLFSMHKQITPIHYPPAHLNNAQPPFYSPSDIASYYPQRANVFYYLPQAEGIEQHDESLFYTGEQAYRLTRHMSLRQQVDFHPITAVPSSIASPHEQAPQQEIEHISALRRLLSYRGSKKCAIISCGTLILLAAGVTTTCLLTDNICAPEIFNG